MTYDIKNPRYNVVATRLNDDEHEILMNLVDVCHAKNTGEVLRNALLYYDKSIKYADQAMDNPLFNDIRFIPLKDS